MYKANELPALLNVIEIQRLHARNPNYEELDRRCMEILEANCMDGQPVTISRLAVATMRMLYDKNKRTFCGSWEDEQEVWAARFLHYYSLCTDRHKLHLESLKGGPGFEGQPSGALEALESHIRQHDLVFNSQINQITFSTGTVAMKRGGCCTIL
jgi:hypothetical protein